MEEKEALRREVSRIMESLRRLVIEQRDSGFEPPDVGGIFQRDPLHARSMEELRILLDGCSRCKT